MITGDNHSCFVVDRPVASPGELHPVFEHNSLARGRKMSDDLSELMLRAYNVESENTECS